MMARRDEDASTRHYGRKKAEEPKKRGPPPMGCDDCRGTGSFAVSVVQEVEGHRRETGYACRCTCPKGADMFRALPTLDQLHKMYTGQVLISPTPNERAGLPPTTLEDSLAVTAQLSAKLAANPGWSLGDAIMNRAGERRMQARA